MCEITGCMCIYFLTHACVHARALTFNHRVYDGSFMRVCGFAAGCAQICMHAYAIMHACVTTWCINLSLYVHACMPV